MKALTLWQPWATLIAVGAKRIETRSWRTSYRGPLAIHAADKWARTLLDIALREPFYGPLAKAGFCGGVRKCHTGLPFGSIVATCRLVDCVRIKDGGLGEGLWLDPLPDMPERAFGDYSPGRFAWILDDVVALDAPSTAAGARQLWEWEGKP